MTKSSTTYINYYQSRAYASTLLSMTRRLVLMFCIFMFSCFNALLTHMLSEEKIFSQIDQSKNILLVSHRRPDGDTVGSAMAFFEYIKIKERTVSAFCVDQIPENLFFLPNTKNYFHDLTLDDLKKFDLIIALDCGDIKQTGIDEILRQKEKHNILINIDHHFTNNNYGDINLVRPEASSTSEVVYTLFSKMNKPISKNMTNALLTGIVTDTTYFSNAGTTIDSIKLASDLLIKGAKIKEVTKNVWKNKNLTALKLWGRVFERLIFNKELGIVTAIVTQEDVCHNDLPDDALEGIANFLTSLHEAKVILVLTQIENNVLKGSLRTTHDDIDVSALAQKLGGGGHKKAAGFTTTGELLFHNNTWSIK